MELHEIQQEEFEKREKMIRRIIGAHAVPADTLTHFIFFLMSVKFLAGHLGPNNMATVTELFVRVWRDSEAEAVVEALKDTLLKTLLTRMKTPDN